MTPSCTHWTLYVILRVVLGELQGGGHCVAVPWVSDLGRLQKIQLVLNFLNTMRCSGSTCSSLD